MLILLGMPLHVLKRMRENYGVFQCQPWLKRFVPVVIADRLINNRIDRLHLFYLGMIEILFDFIIHRQLLHTCVLLLYLCEEVLRAVSHWRRDEGLRIFGSFVYWKLRTRRIV